MRLFVAIWPPDEVVGQLRTLPRKDRRGVRFVPDTNWHVTLRFLGRADPDEVLAALADVRLPRATVRLGPGVDVVGDRSLVVPVDGVDELAAVVRDATAHLGEPPRRRFAGHLTLARLKPGAEMPPAMGAHLAAEWEADEIHLAQSRLLPEGAHYTSLATLPCVD